MKQKFVALPFKIESPNGIMSGGGVGKFSPAGIVLEFEAKLLGLMKTGVKDVRIPKEEIIDAALKSGVFNSKIEKYFSNKIEIRLNNFSTINEVPHHDGKIILKIKRKDLPLAEKAMEALEGKEALQIGESPVYQIYEDETKQLPE